MVFQSAAINASLYRMRTTFSRRNLIVMPAASAAAAQTASAQPDWAKVRNSLLLRKMLYFNAANIGPAPMTVWEAYQKQFANFQSDPSFFNREQYKALSESVRATLAQYVGAKPDEIAITRNASESNNLIAQGVKLESGDEVLITAHNHPSNSASWALRAKQAGATVITAPVPVNAKTPEELVETFASRVTARTKVIAFSHFTNTTGMMYPVQGLVTLASRVGAWVHVDGAQTFGWMRLKLDDWGVDSFSGSFSKWPMGPLESGMLFVKRARLEELSPAILSVDYWSDQPSAARKFETLGQRDDPKLKAIEACLAFHASLGPANVEARTLAVAARLRNGFRALPGVEVRGSGADAMVGPVIKLALGNRNVAAVHDKLRDKYQVAIAKTDSGDSSGLRFSPHIYNLESEVDAVIAAVRECL